MTEVAASVTPRLPRLVGTLEHYALGAPSTLLDAQREIQMRRRLPEGVRMYTGELAARRALTVMALASIE